MVRCLPLDAARLVLVLGVLCAVLAACEDTSVAVASGTGAANSGTRSGGLVVAVSRGGRTQALAARPVKPPHETPGAASEPLVALAASAPSAASAPVAAGTAAVPALGWIGRLLLGGLLLALAAPARRRMRDRR